MQAALFAGFLSAFLIELLNRLEPDPLDTIQDVLIYQTQMMRNSSLGPYVQADFSPPEYIVVVNVLFYASLGVMLLAAFIAMLIKTWVDEFNRGLQGMTIPEQRAKTREFRYLGMEYWKLHWMVALQPLLIQLSLILFAVGLVVFLFHINKPSFRITGAIFGIGVIYYEITTFISIFVTSSPFHSPLSRVFGRLWRIVHASICPERDQFSSPNMDTAPEAAWGRFCRWFKISLQKLRPYSEKGFETPITAATVDECQLLTAASALQRIHDSVPNSPHSQLIHQSVWQVAGSPALRIRPLFKLPSCVFDRGNAEEYLSRLSPAGVVGLTSVFVRMRDALYKGRIASVGHIRSNSRYSQEPRAQLVHAIFDLLPESCFLDERHALDHTLDNALRRDALLHYALPDMPLLDRLRNHLLRDALHNAPVRDTALHDPFLPDTPLPDTPILRPIIVFLIRLLRSLKDNVFAFYRSLPKIARDNLYTRLAPKNLLLRILVFTLIFIFAIVAAPIALALGILLNVIGAVIEVALRGLLAVLRGILLFDKASDDGAFRETFREAFYHTQSYAPYFAFFGTTVFEGLVYVYILFRDVLEDASHDETLCKALFGEAPFRFSLRLLRLGNARLDDITTQGRITRARLEPKEPEDLIDILESNQPQDDEAIWLLNTLSGLHCDGLVLLHVSKICLRILLHKAPKWNQKTPPNIMLIEAVVTLAAISCSSNETYQRKTLTNSLQHPWLLLNLRNPELIGRVIENMDHSSQKELISVLFLVLYGLFLRGSKALAVRYLAIITAKCDFPSCASALAVIAPALGDDAFLAIGRSLMAPQTQFLTPEVDGSMSDPPRIGLNPQRLLDNYDLLLGGSQLPDPGMLAMLLLLSKDPGPDVEQRLQGTDLELRNPWLQLVANVIVQRVIPDESGMVIEPFPDDKVHNMIAALSLSRYSEGKVIHSTARESLLLASFLPSREFAISSLALRHYLETVISYSNLPPPSRYLSGAVHALFSPILPDDYLPKGWEILHMFVDGFENLSIEWRRTFAEAFFIMSHRPLLSENSQNGTPVTELKGILTREYFCKKGQGPVFTDRVFSGLDWMEKAWSLHLSQHSSTASTALSQGAAQPQSVREPPENEEFVLQVLFRLLDAAPYYSILPIIPKLRGFVASFDDARLLDDQSWMSARIEEAMQECKRSYKFQKVNCMLYL